jgi:hypothetical protein
MSAAVDDLRDWAWLVGFSGLSHFSSFIGTILTITNPPMSSFTTG